MKIVIDIDEELVCEGFERQFTEEERDILIRAIGNGTPLPKGHGDLIDRNVAYNVLNNADLSLNCSGLLKYIPTVIPVDEGDKEK